jgi:hypothetical protein
MRALATVGGCGLSGCLPAFLPTFFATAEAFVGRLTSAGFVLSGVAGLDLFRADEAEAATKAAGPSESVGLTSSGSGSHSIMSASSSDGRL